MPEHWEQRSVRSIAKILNGATPATGNPAFWDGDVVWVTPDDLGSLQNRRIGTSARRITRYGYESCGATLAPSGSLVISTRAPIGHTGILDVAACANQGCRLLIPNDTIQSVFLYYLLEVAKPELKSLGQGTTFTELSRGKLAALHIPLPPLPEQAAIVRFLDHATETIRSASERLSKVIRLLQASRTRLTTDVVTGKLDVRDAAAALPNIEVSGANELDDDGVPGRRAELGELETESLGTEA